MDHREPPHLITAETQTTAHITRTPLDQQFMAATDYTATADTPDIHRHLRLTTEHQEATRNQRQLVTTTIRLLVTT